MDASSPIRASDPLSRAAIALREQATPPPRSTPSPYPTSGKITTRHDGIKGDALSAHFAQEDNLLQEDITQAGHKARRSPSTSPLNNTQTNTFGDMLRTPVSDMQTPNTYDIEMCDEFDKDFELVYFEREVGYQARLQSVRRITGITFASFTLYLVIGCFYFSVWSNESKWPLEESLIFLIYTVTTVGYGNHDIPTSQGSRVFIIFYILVGIALVTLVFSEVYQYLILEAARAQYVHDEHKIKEKGLEMSMINELNDEEIQSRRKYDALASRPRERLIRTGLFEMYSRIKHCLTHTKFGQVIITILPFISLLVIGASVVGSLEGWSAVDSLYWAIVTLTTVGKNVEVSAFSLFH